MRIVASLAAIAFISAATAATVRPAAAVQPAATHSMWSGQEITFANGAKIKVTGSTMTTTAEGKSTSIGRSDPDFVNPKGTTIQPMASCAYMRRWLDSHPVNNTWRANSLTYADRCF